MNLAYFLVDLSEYVELKHCKCRPPPDLIQPATNAQSHCVPRDPQLKPAIGTNYLTYYSQNPDCIKSGKPRLHTKSSAQTPRAMCSNIRDPEGRGMGYRIRRWLGSRSASKCDSRHRHYRLPSCRNTVVGFIEGYAKCFWRV